MLERGGQNNVGIDDGELHIPRYNCIRRPKLSTNKYGREPIINENAVFRRTIVRRRTERELVQVARSQLSQLVNYNLLKRFIVRIMHTIAVRKKEHIQ